MGISLWDTSNILGEGPLERWVCEARGGMLCDVVRKPHIVKMRCGEKVACSHHDEWNTTQCNENTKPINSVTIGHSCCSPTWQNYVRCDTFKIASGRERSIFPHSVLQTTSAFKWLYIILNYVTMSQFISILTGQISEDKSPRDFFGVFHGFPKFWGYPNMDGLS